MAAATPTLPPSVVAYQKAHYYDTQAPGIYTGAAFELAVPLITTALRFYARKQRKAPLKSDDWLMLVAVLLCVPLVALRIFSTVQGTSGRHVWAVDPDKFPSFVQAVIAFSFVFCIDIGVMRASILMLYLRLFPLPSFRPYVWTVQVIQLSFIFAVAMVFPLQCIPLRKAWEPTIPGHCVSTTNLVISSASINILMDLAVFFLPVPLLLRLHMSTTRKLALCSVFVMGSGVCFVSIYRAVRSRDYQSPDFTWNTVLLGHLNLIESLGGIFCANATVAYPLFAQPISRWTASVNSASRSKGEPAKQIIWPSQAFLQAGSSDVGFPDAEKHSDASVRAHSDVKGDDVEALHFVAFAERDARS